MFGTLEASTRANVVDNALVNNYGKEYEQWRSIHGLRNKIVDEPKNNTQTNST